MTDKILIVDDEPDNLDVLRNCLREAGFKVLVAEDGKTAIKRVDYIKPDLNFGDVPARTRKRVYIHRGVRTNWRDPNKKKGANVPNTVEST